MKKMFWIYGVISFCLAILIGSCNYGSIIFDVDDDTNDNKQQESTNTNYPGILGSITNSYAYRWSDNILWKVNAESDTTGSNYVSDITPGSNSLIYKVTIPTNDNYTLIAFVDANQNDNMDSGEWNTAPMQNGIRQLSFGTNSISNVNFEVFLPGQRPLPQGTYFTIMGTISNHSMEWRVAATNALTNLVFYSLLSNAKNIGYLSFSLTVGTYDIFLFEDIYPNNGIYNTGTNETTYLLTNAFPVTGDQTNLVFNFD